MQSKKHVFFFFFIWSPLPHFTVWFEYESEGKVSLSLCLCFYFYQCCLFAVRGHVNTKMHQYNLSLNHSLMARWCKMGGGGLWMCATWRTAHHCSAVSTTHSVMVQIRLEICFLFHSLSGKLFSQKCYSLYLGPSPPLLDNFHLLESESGCVIYLTLKPPRDEGWRAGEMIMWLFIRAHL